MCRLVLAISPKAYSGVPADRVLAAAARLAAGTQGFHEKPEMTHFDGWGLIAANHERVWVKKSAERLAVGTELSQLHEAELRFVAVHVRDATEPTKKGLGFTHPLELEGVYLMHNGYLPQLGATLNPPDNFDSRAFLRFVLNDLKPFNASQLLTRLQEMPRGGTSANGFFFKTQPDHHRILVSHWVPPDNPSPKFYRLWHAHRDDLAVIASEPCPELLPEHLWHPMPERAVSQIDITPTQQTISYTIGDCHESNTTFTN